MKEVIETGTCMTRWKVASPESEGLHRCITPGLQDCKEVSILRLNLSKGSDYTLYSEAQEMNAVLIQGRASLCGGNFQEGMDRLDSFYIPGDSRVVITALEPCVFYIGAAVCEGHGTSFFRKYDPDLPLGEIRQIHGSGSGQREVFFTLNPEVEASRLLCGLTWSMDGGWTSWPPHQHEEDLEEAYCYFDMDAPRFGLHLSYLHPGAEEPVIHRVNSGSMVLAPRGYHPTVATPGTINAYFWVLAAFSHESRRYDLAVTDPQFG